MASLLCIPVLSTTRKSLVTRMTRTCIVLSLGIFCYRNFMPRRSSKEFPCASVSIVTICPEQCNKILETSICLGRACLKNILVDWCQHDSTKDIKKGLLPCPAENLGCSFLFSARKWWKALKMKMPLINSARRWTGKEVGGFGRRGKSNKSPWIGSVYPQIRSRTVDKCFSYVIFPKKTELPANLLMKFQMHYRTFPFQTGKPSSDFCNFPGSIFCRLTLSECIVMGWQIIKMRSARWNQNTEGRKLCNNLLS